MNDRPNCNTPARTLKDPSTLSEREGNTVRVRVGNSIGQNGKVRWRIMKERMIQMTEKTFITAEDAAEINPFSFVIILMPKTGFIILSFLVPSATEEFITVR